MSMSPVLRIGTRGSALALAQASEVRARLLAAHPGLGPDDIAVEVIRTTGDRVQDRPLAELGGKGLFTKEIEEALSAGAVDFAVHSMKDVPTALPEGLGIVALLPREDPRDAFLSPQADAPASLPAGAVVGSSSLRRQAQLLALRPDLRIVPFRGNVDTRLRKLDGGEVAATLLACAGLHRLGLAARAARPLPPEIMLPAVAQGAIGIEARLGDRRVLDLLAPLDHPETATAVAAERALLRTLDGSCRTPIAALARLDGERLTLAAEILRPDGSGRLTARREGPAADAEAMGLDAGAELRGRAPADFFQAPA